MSKTPKIVAILLYVAGALLLVGGAGTWYTVSNQLAAENITVTEDASCQQGQAVNGPLEAFCMAEIINDHALESTGGKTYAARIRCGPWPRARPSCGPRCSPPWWPSEWLPSRWAWASSPSSPVRASPR